MPWLPIAPYALAAAAVVRGAASLVLHGLARPGRPARLRRNGQLVPR
jgi:hypothetical protein